MKKNSCFNFIIAAVVSVLILTFSGNVFAAEPAKPKPAATEKKPNMNQMAFIAKFDKNGDGKVDKTEFKGQHFATMDKNGDGFVEPHEAPEGETAY